MRTLLKLPHFADHFDFHESAANFVVREWKGAATMMPSGCAEWDADAPACVCARGGRRLQNRPTRPAAIASWRCTRSLAAWSRAPTSIASTPCTPRPHARSWARRVHPTVPTSQPTLALPLRHTVPLRFCSLLNLHAPREIVDALGKTGGSGKAAARSKDGASTKGPA